MPIACPICGYTNIHTALNYAHRALNLLADGADKLAFKV